MNFSEFRSYSPIHDAEVIRLSVAKEPGKEYFAVLTEVEGAAYRLAKVRALNALADAIDAGAEPGEVKMDSGTRA